MCKIKQKQHGFTLVELSVVIVLIGLIVAGVIGAQNLVELAKSRKLMGQIQSFKVAFNTFYLEFEQYPGDMSNASSYWSSCTTANGSVCNGDGNRRYGSWGSNEGERGWHHLSLAGLLPYSFDNSSYGAVIGGWASESKPGVTSPKFDQYATNEICAKFWRESHSLFGSLSGKNIITIRGIIPTDANHTCWQGNAGIPVKVAHQIDNKLDDGEMRTGHMTVIGTWGGSSDGTCHNGSLNWAFDGGEGQGCNMFISLRE